MEFDFYKIQELKIHPKTNKIESPEGSQFLTPRLMRLLVFFLENPNRIVTKDELLEKVWEDRIVTDNLLTKSISELRNFVEKALLGAGSIETVRSVGYEFRCDESRIFRERAVQKTEKPPPENFDGDFSKATTPKFSGEGFSVFSKRQTRWLLGLAVLALAAWLVFRQFSKPETPISASILPATTDAGQEFQPAFSPDGKFMAWSAKVENDPFCYVFVKNAGAASGRRLSAADSVFEFSPCWSPNGSQIAFFRKRPKDAPELVVCPAMGGPETSFGKIEMAQISNKAVWTADQKLIFSGKTAADRPFQIHVFDLEKRVLKNLTQPDSSLFGDRFTCLLPKNRLVFMRFQLGSSRLAQRSEGAGSLVELDLNSGKEKIWAKTEEEVTALAWSPVLEKLFGWQKREAAGDYALLEFQPGGEAKIVTTVDHFRPESMAAHPKNASLFFEAWDAQTDVFEWKLGQNEPPHRILASTRWDWHPRFFAGGQRATFLSDRSGSTEIWAAETASPENSAQISSFGKGQILWQSPSPTGDSILIHAKFDGREGIFLFEIPGKKLSVLLLGESRFAHPEWLLDGGGFCFSKKENGAWAIWRRGFSGNLDEKLTENGASRGIPILENGQPMLLFVSDADPDLHLKNLTTGRESRFPGKENNWQKTNFCVGGQGVFSENWVAGTCRLQFFDLKNFERRTLLTLQNVVPDLPGLAVSPDGKRVWVTMSDRISVDLMEARLR